MLLQQLYLIPRVRRARKHGLLPRHARKENVIFNLLVVHLFELAAEHGITEARLVANTRSEGDVRIVEISRSPCEGPRVESDDEHFITVILGAVEKLGNGQPLVEGAQG